MRIMLITLLLVGLSACTTVKPWERGALANPNMGWQPAASAAALNNHIYFSKEASSGGGQAAGGGCGCN